MQDPDDVCPAQVRPPVSVEHDLFLASLDLCESVVLSQILALRVQGT